MPSTRTMLLLPSFTTVSRKARSAASCSASARSPPPSSRISSSAAGAAEFKISLSVAIPLFRSKSLVNSWLSRSRSSVWSSSGPVLVPLLPVKAAAELSGPAEFVFSAYVVWSTVPAWVGSFSTSGTTLRRFAAALPPTR